MKRLLLFLAALCCYNLSIAQCSGLQIVGLTGDNPDVLCFQATAAIAGGTVFHITDNEWNSTTEAFVDTNESENTWTAPAGGVTAGEIICITDANDATTVSASCGTWAGPSLFINAGGEDIYITSVAPSSTAGSVTAADICFVVSTGGTGDIPAGSGVNVTNLDNTAYNGSGDITDPVNWTSSNGAVTMPTATCLESACIAITPGTPSCETTTVGATSDTWTVTIAFTGGGSDTYTVAPNDGALDAASDDPDVDATGNLIYTGITEGTDLSFTITSTGGCSIVVMVTSPTCEPAGGTGDCPPDCAIVISEIMYNPASDESSSAAVNSNNEWIEIVNTSGMSLDMEGWILTDGDGNIVIPAGTTIPAGAVMVLGDATLAEFNAAWGPGFTSANYVQVTIKADLMRLGNSPSPTNEIIQILCSDGTTVLDEVNYDDAFGWPSSTNGFSIYLDPCDAACNTTLADNICAIDNNEGTSWSLSAVGVNGAFTDLGSVLPFDGDDTGSPGTICEDRDVDDCVQQPLPVNLVSFTARKLSSEVVLLWSTSMEINNDFFVVEWSADGKSFIPLDNVQGYGNSNVIMDYSYTHRNPSNGANYYRLRQVDMDGVYEYSDIEIVNYKMDDFVNVYPGIIDQFLTVELLDGQSGSIDVFSISGQLMKQQFLSGETEVDLSNLNSGMYIARINFNNHVITKRIIKK